MFRTRSPRRSPDRRGAILMVVLALLALFAVVGLSFVLLAESEASSARINATSLTTKPEDQLPDAQQAYNLSLGVMIYGNSETDPNALQSGLRGHEFASTMYPRNPNTPGRTFPAGTTESSPFSYLSAFSGKGLFLATDPTDQPADPVTIPLAGAPPTYAYSRSKVINYAYQPGAGYIFDPEWEWYRDGTGAVGGGYSGTGYPAVAPAPTIMTPRYKSQATPYTFPDSKDIYLAVIDHSDPTNQTLGRVLQPSYYRSYDWRSSTKYTVPATGAQVPLGPFMPDPAAYPGYYTANPNPTGLEPTNPCWYDAQYRMAIVRPRAVDQLTIPELQSAIGLSYVPVNPTPVQVQKLQQAIAFAATQPGGIFPDPAVNADGSVTGDVTNLTAVQGPSRADSIWIYPGGPVMKYKGKPYVAMIAPLVIDLSGRVNLSMAGNNTQQVTDPQGPSPKFPPTGTLMPLSTSHGSYGGFWPGEVNPIQLFSLVPDNSPSPPEADINKGQRALLQLLGGGRMGVPYGVQTAAGRYGLNTTTIKSYTAPYDPTSVPVPADALTGQKSLVYNGGLIPPHYARVNVTGAGTGTTDRLNPAGTGVSPFPSFPTNGTTNGVPSPRFYDSATLAQYYSGNHPAQLNPDYAPPGGTAGRVYSYADLRKLVLPNRASDKPASVGNSYAYYYGQTDLGTLAPWQLVSGNYGMKGNTAPYPDRTFNPNNPQYTIDYGNPTPPSNDPAQLVRMLVTTFSSSTSRPEAALRGQTVSGATPIYRLGPVDVTRPLHDFRIDTTKPLSQSNLLPYGPKAWNYTVADYQKYALARRDRQNLARDIFLRLVGIANDAKVKATGTYLIDGTVAWYVPPSYAVPTMATPAGSADGGYLRFDTTSPQYANKLNELRPLAQIAVNMVDYLDPDDMVTPFVWNPVYTNTPDPILGVIVAPATAPVDPSFLADPSADYANNFNPPAPDAIGNHVVFGTELPRVVVNEAYAMVGNSYKDLKAGGGAATENFQMKFWLELHNPLAATTDPSLSDNGSGRLQYPAFNNPKDGSAYFTQYAVHQIVIAYNGAGQATQFTQSLTTTNPGNVTGDPGVLPAGAVKIRVTDYTPSPNTPAPPATVTYDRNKVNPAAGATSGPDGATGDNQGYYVIGPEVQKPGASGFAADAFPGSDTTKADVNCTLRLDYPAAGAPSPVNAMIYDTGTRISADLKGGADLLNRTHTVILRRLANPYLPPNDPSVTTATPGFPAYDSNLPPNLFVTVDYLEGVPTRDQVWYDSNGAYDTMNRGNFADGKATNDTAPSVGRRHPYSARAGGTDPANTLAYSDVAGEMNQFITRQSAPAGSMTNPSPANNFFSASNPFMDGAGAAPRWLVHMDRQLVNAVELASVSATPPALMTQAFASTNGAGAAGALTSPRYNTHTMEAAVLPGMAGGLRKILGYDLKTTVTAPATEQLEGFMNGTLGLLTTRPAYFGMPAGGREVGRVNINTAARAEVFKALFDPNDGNYFATEDVQNKAKASSSTADGFWDRVTGDVTAKATRDFSLGTPIGGIGGTTTAPSDTVLRNGGPSGKPLFYNTFANTATPPSDTSHAKAITEPLSKVWNSSTTTSNSFLVVVTVGFFEVRDPDNSTGPLPAGPAPNGRLYFGQELYKDVPGDLRQQFVSVVDRTGLGVELDTTVSPPKPTGLQASPAPQDQGKVWFTTLVEDAMPGATSIKVAAATNNPNGTNAQTGTNAYIFVDGNQVSLLGRTVRIGFGDKDITDSFADGEFVGLPALPANVTAPSTVSQVAVGANGVMSISLPAPIQKYHPAGSPVTNVTLGHPGPQPNFKVDDPRYKAVVPYTVQVTPTQSP